MRDKIMAQATHNAVALHVFSIACGDLALNPAGNLTTKRFYDAETILPLPEGKWEHGVVLARISHAGWTITPHGADYMLECWSECFTPFHLRFLRAVAELARAVAA